MFHNVPQYITAYNCLISFEYYVIIIITGAYSNWAVIYPEVYNKILSVENSFISAMKELDTQALNVYNSQGPSAAVDMVTKQCTQFGDSLVQQWGQFFGQIFMKYRDSYVITPDADNTACGCSPANAPYSQEWYNRIVTDTKDHYLVPAAQNKKGYASPVRDIAKLKLLARR